MSGDKRLWKPTHHIKIDVYERTRNGGRGRLEFTVEEDVLQMLGPRHPSDKTRQGMWYQKKSEVLQIEGGGGSPNLPPDITFYTYPEEHMAGQGTWELYSCRTMQVVYEVHLKELSDL